MVKMWLWYLLYFVLYFVGLSVVWAYLVFGRGGGNVPAGLVLLFSALILLLLSGILWWAMDRLYRQLKPMVSKEPWRFYWVKISVLYGVGILIGVNVYEHLLRWAHRTELMPENQNILMHAFHSAPLLTSLYAIVIAPILEEYLFRGLLFALLGRYVNKQVWIIVLTSLIFGLLHEPRLDLNMLVYMSMGVALGTCYWHTGQLRYAILAHMMNNAVSVLMLWLMFQSA